MKIEEGEAEVKKPAPKQTKTNRRKNSRKSKKSLDNSQKDVIITHDLTKPSINTKLALISEKAFKELGWSPATSLDEGIIKTIKWYKNNFREK